MDAADYNNKLYEVSSKIGKLGLNLKENNENFKIAS